MSSRLVSIGQGESPGTALVSKGKARLVKKSAVILDSERLETDPVNRRVNIDEGGLNPGNLGPNTPAYEPQRYGLLDYQDIALFLWPPYRQREHAFNVSEQCLILRHRNARLADMAQVELVEVQSWIEKSETIRVEGKEVDLRDWRLHLSEEELKARVKRMGEDLKRSKTILGLKGPDPMQTTSKEAPAVMATPPRTPPKRKAEFLTRSQRLAARRRIDDDSD